MTGVPRARGAEEGQATVEVALALPVLCLLALFVVQVGLVVHHRVLLTHAAREAARASAVTADPAAPRRAAVAAGPLDPGHLRVEVDRGAEGGTTTVRLELTEVTDVPVVGVLLPDVTLTATTTMRVER